MLRGLDIDGSPTASPGLNGIRFLQGASLIVDDCVIRDFKGGAPNGNGIIVINSSLVASVHVINSNISGNGTGTTGAGIQIAPTGTGGANVTITNSVFSNNIVGVRADSAATSGAIDVTVTDSTAAGAPFHGFVALGAGGPVRMMLNRVTSTNNLGEGVRAAGANADIRIGSSVVTGNGTGLAAASSGQIQSYGNKQRKGNTVDGSPPAVPLKKHRRVRAVMVALYIVNGCSRHARRLSAGGLTGSRAIQARRISPERIHRRRTTAMDNAASVTAA